MKKNPIVKFPTNPRYKTTVNFSGYIFLDVSYTKPEGLRPKDQVFMPTWMLTAMILTRAVRNLGVREIIDLFAGDGRIQYFASSIGLRSYGIECCEQLTDVQKQITEKTGVELGTIQGDAIQKRDYSCYNLKKPAFFISVVEGVRERAFECLVSSLKEYTPELLEESIFVTIHGDNNRLTPVFESEKYLNTMYCLDLPTHWDLKTNYRISKLKF